MKATRSAVTAAALTAARIAGCTCSPEVAVTTDPQLPGVDHATVSHDAWCPLLHRRAAKSN